MNLNENYRQYRPNADSTHLKSFVSLDVSKSSAAMAFKTDTNIS